jgi:hypothetical protein
VLIELSFIQSYSKKLIGLAESQVSKNDSNFIYKEKKLIEKLSNLKNIIKLMHYLVACESHDDLAEVRERAVDALSLLQSHTGRSRLLQALRAGQVNLKPKSKCSVSTVIANLQDVL